MKLSYIITNKIVSLNDIVEAINDNGYTEIHGEPVLDSPLFIAASYAIDALLNNKYESAIVNNEYEAVLEELNYHLDVLIEAGAIFDKQKALDKIKCLNKNEWKG